MQRCYPTRAGVVTGVVSRAMANAMYEHTDKEGRGVRLGAVLDVECGIDKQAVPEALLSGVQRKGVLPKELSQCLRVVPWAVS